MTGIASAVPPTELSGGAIEPREEPGKDPGLTSSAKDTRLTLGSSASLAASGIAAAGGRKVGNGLGNWKK
jgi:hypothetical protein